MKKSKTMKTYIIILSAAAVILIAGGCFLFNFLNSKVNIPDTGAKLNYIYNDKNISIDLSTDESKLFKDIFNGKRLYNDSPSCGFSKNVSICFDDLFFCVACDKCPIVKLNGKYFKISEAEQKSLINIFEKYGGFFPCI